VLEERHCRRVRRILILLDEFHTDPFWRKKKCVRINAWPQSVCDDV
jgi:hypothetical protein